MAEETTGSVVATVTDDSPVTVIADGATVANPAESLNGAALTIGWRVQLTLRTPRQPLVTGKVTTA